MAAVFSAISSSTFKPVGGRPLASSSVKSEGFSSSALNDKQQEEEGGEVLLEEEEETEELQQNRGSNTTGKCSSSDNSNDNNVFLKRRRPPMMSTTSPIQDENSVGLSSSSSSLSQEPSSSIENHHHHETDVNSLYSSSSYLHSPSSSSLKNWQISSPSSSSLRSISSGHSPSSSSVPLLHSQNNQNNQNSNINVSNIRNESNIRKNIRESWKRTDLMRLRSYLLKYGTDSIMLGKLLNRTPQTVCMKLSRIKKKVCEDANQRTLDPLLKSVYDAAVHVRSLKGRRNRCNDASSSYIGGGSGGVVTSAVSLSSTSSSSSSSLEHMSTSSSSSSDSGVSSFASSISSSCSPVVCVSSPTSESTPSMTRSSCTRGGGRRRCATYSTPTTSSNINNSNNTNNTNTNTTNNNNGEGASALNIGVSSGGGEGMISTTGMDNDEKLIALRDAIALHGWNCEKLAEIFNLSAIAVYQKVSRFWKSEATYENPLKYEICQLAKQHGAFPKLKRPDPPSNFALHNTFHPSLSVVSSSTSSSSSPTFSPSSSSPLASTSSSFSSLVGHEILNDEQPLISWGSQTSAINGEGGGETAATGEDGMSLFFPYVPPSSLLISKSVKDEELSAFIAEEEMKVNSSNHRFHGLMMTEDEFNQSKWGERGNEIVKGGGGGGEGGGGFCLERNEKRRKVDMNDTEILRSGMPSSIPTAAASASAVSWVPMMTMNTIADQNIMTSRNAHVQMSDAQKYNSCLASPLPSSSFLSFSAAANSFSSSSSSSSFYSSTSFPPSSPSSSSPSSSSISSSSSMACYFPCDSSMACCSLPSVFLSSPSLFALNSKIPREICIPVSSQNYLNALTRTAAAAASSSSSLLSKSPSSPSPSSSESLAAAGSWSSYFPSSLYSSFSCCSLSYSSSSVCSSSSPLSSSSLSPKSSSAAIMAGSFPSSSSPTSFSSKYSLHPLEESYKKVLSVDPLWNQSIPDYKVLCKGNVIFQPSMITPFITSNYEPIPPSSNSFFVSATSSSSSSSSSSSASAAAAAVSSSPTSLSSLASSQMPFPSHYSFPFSSSSSPSSSFSLPSLSSSSSVPPFSSSSSSSPSLSSPHSCSSPSSSSYSSSSLLPPPSSLPSSSSPQVANPTFTHFSFPGRPPPSSIIPEIVDCEAPPFRRSSCGNPEGQDDCFSEVRRQSSSCGGGEAAEGEMMATTKGILELRQKSLTSENRQVETSEESEISQEVFPFHHRYHNIMVGEDGDVGDGMKPLKTREDGDRNNDNNSSSSDAVIVENLRIEGSSHTSSTSNTGVSSSSSPNSSRRGTLEKCNSGGINDYNDKRSLGRVSGPFTTGDIDQRCSSCFPSNSNGERIVASYPSYTTEPDMFYVDPTSLKCYGASAAAAAATFPSVASGPFNSSTIAAADAHSHRFLLQREMAGSPPSPFPFPPALRENNRTFPSMLPALLPLSSPCGSSPLGAEVRLLNVSSPKSSSWGRGVSTSSSFELSSIGTSTSGVFVCSTTSSSSSPSSRSSSSYPSSFSSSSSCMSPLDAAPLVHPPCPVHDVPHLLNLPPHCVFPSPSASPFSSSPPYHLHSQYPLIHMKASTTPFPPASIPPHPISSPMISPSCASPHVGKGVIFDPLPIRSRNCCSNATWVSPTTVASNSLRCSSSSCLTCLDIPRSSTNTLSPFRDVGLAPHPKYLESDDRKEEDDDDKAGGGEGDEEEERRISCCSSLPPPPSPSPSEVCGGGMGISGISIVSGGQGGVILLSPYETTTRSLFLQRDDSFSPSVVPFSTPLGDRGGGGGASAVSAVSSCIPYRLLSAHCPICSVNSQPQSLFQQQQQQHMSSSTAATASSHHNIANNNNGSSNINVSSGDESGGGEEIFHGSSDEFIPPLPLVIRSLRSVPTAATAGTTMMISPSTQQQQQQQQQEGMLMSEMFWAKKLIDAEVPETFGLHWRNELSTVT